MLSLVGEFRLVYICLVTATRKLQNLIKTVFYLSYWQYRK